MSTMAQISLPSSLPEVERLVKMLYEPNSASTIHQVQQTLQRLQRLPEGWQIAEGLLARPGDDVKFFGALTFVVKLNTDPLDDEAAGDILQRLFAIMLKSLHDGSGAIVIRKLCSALVTHFIHFSHLWPLSVRGFLYCLHLNRSEAILDAMQDPERVPPVEQLISTLTPRMVVAAIWFAASLAEDIAKTDPKTTKYIGLHERLLDNSADVASLLANLLANPSGSEEQAEAIGCFQAWVFYGQRNSTERLILNLRPLIQPTIQCLPIDRLYEGAIDILTEALGTWGNIFTREDHDILYSLFESPWSREKHQSLMQGDFEFDSVQFGLFLVAFGSSRIPELIQNPTSSLLAALAGLLSAQGYPVAEDKIFVPALEFWSEFVEAVVDEVDYGEQDDKHVNWRIQTLSVIMQIVSHCWRKIQYPPQDIFNSWESTERVGFSDARKDVSDLLQSVHSFSGKQIVSLFADLILRALSSRSWAELEAAAFGLGSLAICIGDDAFSDDGDAILAKVFGSPLFDLLQHGQETVPVRVRQTCLSLIERYTDYFERHAEFLPAALNLLFTAVNEHHLSNHSSKSIYRLCSSCRSSLTSEVQAFLGQYEALRMSQNLDSLAEERIAGAVASVIQAVQDEPRRLEAFRQLLMLIGADVEQCLQLRSYDGLVDPTNPVVARALDVSLYPAGPVSASEVASHLATRALRCLLGTAKGLQEPGNSLIDLESDTIPVTSQQSHILSQIQKDILEILNRLRNTFTENSEAVGVICSIIRTGFSEQEPGPFVFPAQLVTGFLTGPWPTRIAAAVYTARVFVSSRNNGSGKREMDEALGQLLPWVVGIMQQLPDPADEPELAQYAMEFAQETMTKRPEVFIQLQPTSLLEYIFMFAIKLTNGNEPLPKTAALEFWTSFLTLKADDENTQAALGNAVANLGPILSHALVMNIGGNASRSELDKLSDPLRKMVVQHVGARRWLEAALNDTTFPSTKVSSADKALFLKKVISLRGLKATNQVVREFWLACRGSNFAYAS